jgi:hypothetical protein
MTRMRRLSRLAFIVALVAAAVSPSGAQEPPSGLTVTARVDRPAIWIADRLTYTVEIVCPRGLDILTEDLGRDRLKLTGLDIVSSNLARRQEGDVTRYVSDYILTTYRVDVPTPSIGSFPVRYYLTRAGQRPEDAAPAGSVLVPEVVVAFRSLLPDDQPGYQARAPQSVPARWIVYRSMEPVGIGLIVVAMAPVAILVARLVRRLRARRLRAARPSARQTRQAARAAFDEIRALEATDLAARRDAFARLDSLIRRHIAETCGVAADGLTPDEIAAAIEPCAARVPLELVTAILAVCELARYGTPVLQPTIEAWRETVERAEHVLFTGR